jgi:NAD(P)-dependent dehydrogenase (short-subunit alcohol dehydrogenase family)
VPYISLTRAAALQLGPDRIRVNCICPGAINTPIWGSLPAFSDPASVAQVLDHAQTIPRVGRPEDIASMVLFLASDESEWVTGQAMIVDGGLTVGPGGPRPSRALEATAPPPPTQGAYVGPSFKR